MHDHLRRLFHELGHAMHNIVSKTRCARFHGPSGNRDFAETVGIMFENFLWTPRHMKDISLHYSYLSPEYLEAWKKENPGVDQPPRKIGDDLIERLVKLRRIGIAGTELSKVWMAKFDMAIHSPKSHQEVIDMDPQTLYNKIRAEATGLSGPEPPANEEETWKWGHAFSSFRGIAGGYDAGYYTYSLSQVYSFDLFRHGFGGDTMSKEKGRRFRNVVLEPGGSRDGMDILKTFLGRDVDERAYWEGLGL
jgi:metallopeptidase MepB